ncbi:probable low affinity copper uptake protein 2 isoform X3 [Chiloscyllium plagiosum]|uniref:probable low affinity copper uptake protein 2 isoform X3 n=1 Tax=Chiloscyllium plagiosum TaxID=36176 RepID=UPI001CB875A6|nr:probable low affinity copper uptake protein 2 isoform X3 [Chiloscyllium plagiosum]
MMPMYFFASDQVVLLFDFWNIHSVAGMVLTVVIVLLMTVLYEMLKVETVKLDKKILDLMASPPNPQDETAETLPINPNSQKTSCKRLCSLTRDCTTKGLFWSNGSIPASGLEDMASGPTCFRDVS